MKKVSAFTIAATFAGCFLGAGYVSGQEILQYFASHGETWWMGLLLSVIFQFLLGTVILLVAKSSGNISMDSVAIQWEIPWLRGAMGVMLSMLLFTINVTMFAGFGAMLHQLTGLPTVVGSILLVLVVTALSMLGLRGMVAAFSLFVPALSVTAVVICIATLLKHGVQPVVATADPSFLGGWAIAALTFVSYNIFGSIGMLTPMAQFLRKKRTACLGIAMGSVMLTVIAAGIVLAISAYPASREAELPMLAVATDLSPAMGIVYAVMLFGGMLGTSLAGTVAIDVYLQHKIPAIKTRRNLLLATLGLLGLGCSFIGFSEIVGKIYPLFGYGGFVAILGVFIHFFTICLRKRKIAPSA